jgi:hypothetical protein
MLLHNIRQQKQRQKLKKTMMILSHNKTTKKLRFAIKKKRKAWGRREEKSEAKFKCLLCDKGGLGVLVEVEGTLE